MRLQLVEPARCAAALPDEFRKIRRKPAGPLALVCDRKFRRVQSMTWQEKFLLELISPTGFYETEVQVLIWTVDFIAYNRMAH